MRAWPRWRANEISGSTSDAGASEDHSGVAPPFSAKAKPPTKTGPAAAGRSGSQRGVVGHDPPAEIARPHGHLAETAWATRLQRDRAAEPGEDEAVPVGLLEAEEAVVGAARLQHGGREVELGRHGHGHRGEGRGAVAPGAIEGTLDALRQRFDRRVAQLERAGRARCRERHSFKG